MATSAAPATKLNLFLSYAHADRALAEQLRVQLRDDGHNVWQDTEELLTGDSFQALIRQTLRTCQGYVVLITPRSLASAWVLMELGGAWIGGIPIFPVLADTSPADVPPPVRDLSCSFVHEVPAKLLPALRRLHQRLDTDRGRAFDGAALDDLAAKSTLSITPPSLRGQVASLITEALSTKRDIRRMAHTTVQQGPEHLEREFLRVMGDLITHENDWVRGEAYYCLGYIPLRDGSYACDEQLLRDGLSDDSVYVQACCTNALRNFRPLDERTNEKLSELLAYHIMRARSDDMSAKLVYYASLALTYWRPGGKVG